MSVNVNTAVSDLIDININSRPIKLKEEIVLPVANNPSDRIPSNKVIDVLA